MACNVVGSGFGILPVGSGPFGSGSAVAGGDEDFDIFCFEPCASMGEILTDPSVTTTSDSGQLEVNYPDGPPPPVTTNDLGILSGELGNPGFSTDNVIVSVEPTSGVPGRWTMEWVVKFENLPPDFSDLVNKHIYFGASDSAGPVAGVFVSQAGIAYTGSIHHSGGDLVVDSGIQVLPGSAANISLNTSIVFRLAVDGINGVAYLFVTNEDDVAITGQQLIAVLPTIDANDVAFPPSDQAIISIRGTTPEPSRLALDKWCMGQTVLVPNLPPIALAGADQAVRLCSVAQLDGTASFDPEGTPLTYSWRLIGAPSGSSFSIFGTDGSTDPLVSPTGFTDKFYSAVLGIIHAADALETGDVLFVGGQVYDIVTTGSDVGGFYALVSVAAIPDSFASQSFYVFRQRGLSGTTTAKPTFLPDVPGFYKFDLFVDDGLLFSKASIVVVNVVDSPLPRGVIPDTKFIFDYMSDYWSLLEDRDPISTIWSGLAQVASAELYTLWQHEYSKSLRDIQRTFLRKWLHFDLLIGEPLSELTTIRVLYSGVATSSMSPGGEVGISNTGFRVSSSVHADRNITILSANPVTAPVLAGEIRNRLLEVDGRYTTTVITDSGGDQTILINAPFPFSIVSSNLPVLSISSSDNLSGGGTAMGSRTYKVDRSLLGVGVQENDLLVLGDQAFRVSQLASDPSDDFPLQRVILKSDIPQTGVTDWDLSGHVRSELLDFYNGLISRGDYVYFEVSDDEDGSSGGDNLVLARALGVSADEVSRLAFEITPELGAVLAAPARFTVRLAKILRRSYLPIDPLIVDIPTLSDVIQIVDDKTTLRRNVDFYLEEYRGRSAIRFESGQFSSGDVWENLAPPPRLWAEFTYLDNRPTIEDNFGLLAEVSVDQIEALPGNVDYLSAVRGIWYAYVNGPTMFNLRVGAQILLGLPFAEESGTIEEVRTDFSPNFGRILVRDKAQSEIVRSYTFPRSLDLELNPDTGAAYTLGDSVSQFAPLVKGVEVVDYVSDPTWYEGLVNQGVFYEVEKFNHFLVRVDSAAFGAESLSFVNDFMLKIKPLPTYPFFMVTVDLGEDTTVSVTDETAIKVTLNLLDITLVSLTPFSTSFDDARAAGGGYWNQFDTDSDTATPPPSFPTSNTVEWAFDRYVLTPGDILTAFASQVFPSPALASTGVNLFPPGPLLNTSKFVESGPFIIVSGATGESITAVAGATIPRNGTIVFIKVFIAGGPGASPTNYELVYSVNGVDEAAIPFTATPTLSMFSTVVSKAVVTSDVIAARIRFGAGSNRSPSWTQVRVEIVANVGTFASGDNLPAGNYSSLTVMT